MNRLSLEDNIIGPIRTAVLAPERIVQMAKEMQAYYAEQLQGMQARGTEAPRELQELNARIQRLRERLKHGDADMLPDEIQAAIDRAEVKRLELDSQQPGKGTAKVLSILPKAPEMFRRQIADGLNGNEREALKSRVILREMCGGRIDLKREGEELWAEYGLQPAALLRIVGNRGSGGLLRAL
ncbi:MAG: Resolvase protein [Gammaproteobacteria bacterium]|nr:Resolvase protein [Gammaproteobacteria bacterium]